MMVALAFGGRGTIADPLPDALPHSALVFAGRVEAMVAEALAVAFVQAGAFEPRRRDTAMRRLEAFAPEIQVVLVELTLELGDGLSAPVHLAAPVASLASLCGIGTNAGPSGPATSADPAREPFADIPIELGARLVDARVPAMRVGALKPGSVLALAVARRVPLRIGDRVIAWGSLGSLDDCAALQIIELA
jgi:flagellar motor switch protein FliM